MLKAIKEKIFGSIDKPSDMKKYTWRGNLHHFTDSNNAFDEIDISKRSNGALIPKSFSTSQHTNKKFLKRYPAIEKANRRLSFELIRDAVVLEISCKKDVDILSGPNRISDKEIDEFLKEGIDIIKVIDREGFSDEFAIINVDILKKVNDVNIE